MIRPLEHRGAPRKLGIFPKSDDLGDDPTIPSLFTVDEG
jgi:hypothetical protein